MSTTNQRRMARRRQQAATPAEAIPLTIHNLPPEERAKFYLALGKYGYESPQEILRATLKGEAADPVAWAKKRLGAHLWSKQRDICISVRDNKYTAVHSCHGVGKSWIAALIVCHFLASHEPGTAQVVTTAPTWKQVKNILWKYIRRMHATGDLGGRCMQTEWHMRTIHGSEEAVAIGLKPANTDPTAFQGIHAPRVLVVVDEACGVAKSLWDAIAGLVTNDNCRVLAIGNPDDPATEFYEVCHGPRTPYNVIHISAFDSPNFTGEWVPDYLREELVSPGWQQDQLRKWGETNPLYISKVLGEFPEVTEGTLIPLGLIAAARRRKIEYEPGDQIIIGCDVGGGGDANVIGRMKGRTFKILSEDYNNDTMQTLSKLIQYIRNERADEARIDKIGIGWGAANRAKEIGKTKNAPNRESASKIVGIQVSASANDKKQFHNLRAEGYWALREAFQAGNIAMDEHDDDTAAQLADLRFHDSAGRIVMESKEEMKARGSHSPNRADTFMLAHLPSKKKHRLAAGRSIEEVRRRQAARRESRMSRNPLMRRARVKRRA